MKNAGHLDDALQSCLECVAVSIVYVQKGSREMSIGSRAKGGAGAGAGPGPGHGPCFKFGASASGRYGFPEFGRAGRLGPAPGSGCLSLLSYRPLTFLRTA